MPNQKYLPVTVDKSHLITIGEKMYAESIELVREFVSNAYDADAENVKIEINKETITIEDDGLGMDYNGLKQYFNIGSPQKKEKAVSKKFKRHYIGQFGIGKFASLSAADRFEIITKKGEFAAKVTFDKKQWQEAPEHWRLPLMEIDASTLPNDGAAVILSGLNKSFELEEVENRLRETMPLNIENFNVYLNGKKLEPKLWQGRRLPFFEGTPFGLVHGEIVIIPATQATTKDIGIDIKVKKVTIKKELFNMVTWGKDAARIKGEIHADFLPITSDRSNFILDSSEYKEFLKAVQKVIEEIKKILGSSSVKAEKTKAKRAMKEALTRVHNALARHPEFSPFGVIPQSDTEGPGGAADLKKSGGNDAGADEGNVGANTVGPKKKRNKKTPVKNITPNAVVQKMRFGTRGVACCVDSFGPDGPESFTQSDVIYINRDHPLYIRQLKKQDAHTMHIAQLITKEVALMKNIKNPRKVFESQSILLRDAFAY